MVKENTEVKKEEKFVEKETKEEVEVSKSEEIKKDKPSPSVDNKLANSPKKKSKANKKEEIIELEREYIIPLRKNFLNVPRYRRAKKAIKGIKEFLVRHMRVEGRDLNKVKIDINLNNEVWFRGIKKPCAKIKVKAVKKSGIVYVELAEVPEVVKFNQARLKKRAKKAESVKGKSKPLEKEVVDKDKDGVEDKIEEKEDIKSVEEKAAKVQKAAAKEVKHTAKGAHAKKTMPVRKSLKK